MAKRGHNEGSIYQRKSDGRWVACLPVQDAAGRKKKVYRYRQTRTEARKALRQLQRRVEDGLQAEAGNETLARYLQRWLNASVKPSVRPKTHQGYESIVRNRIVPNIGGVKLSKLTPAIIQELYSELAEDGLAPRSIINTHRVLRRALSQALKWGLIIRNPCDAVDTPRASRPEMQTLSRQQAEEFLDKTADDRLHALFVLALTTGMRLGELLGLQWDDIDFSGRRLQVLRSLQFVTGQGHIFNEPKTTSSRRTVMLSNRAVEALRDHRRKQLEERLQFPDEWEMPELVFPNYRGAPLNPGNVSNSFKQTLERLGLPVIRFHDTRHTAATLLLQAGTHVKLVSEMLGHSTIVITLDTYSHVIPTMHEEAARTMDKLLGGQAAL